MLVDTPHARSSSEVSAIQVATVVWLESPFPQVVGWHSRCQWHPVRFARQWSPCYETLGGGARNLKVRGEKFVAPLRWFRDKNYILLAIKFCGRHLECCIIFLSIDSSYVYISTLRSTQISSGSRGAFD